jgi:hypothetical protein
MLKKRRLRDGNRLNRDLNEVQEVLSKGIGDVEWIMKTLQDHSKRIKRLEKLNIVVVFLIIGLIAIIILGVTLCGT